MIERFGVTIDWRGAMVGALTTISLQADHSGCGYLWIPEAWGLEAFSTIGHLLTITKRIKVGTGIVNVFSRSAGTIAMACATLNQLGPQRFLLGLGTSAKGLVEAFHGIKYEKGFKRTLEYAEAITKIQSGEPIDYDGEILKLSRFRLFATPATPPVPIYLGAMGESNLALAGRIASGAIVTLYPISKLAHCLDLVNKEDPSKMKPVFAYIPFRVTNNEREEESAKEEVAKFVSFYIASMGNYYSRNLTRLGFGKVVDEIRSAVASGAGTLEASKLIKDDFLNEFCFIGTPRQIMDRLARIPEGIHPVFAMNASSVKEGDKAARAIRELSLELSRRKPQAK